MANALRRRRRLHLHLRQLRVNAGPTWRAGCPDGHRGAGEIWIIERSDSNEDQVGSCLSLAKEWSTAISAKATVHSIAAVRGAQKVARLSRNVERRRAKASANRSTSRAQVLTVTAPTHARNDRRFPAFPANRTAEASASYCHRSLQYQKRENAHANRSYLLRRSSVAMPPNHSIEGTSTIRLRLLAAAPHVKR